MSKSAAKCRGAWWAEITIVSAPKLAPRNSANFLPSTFEINIPMALMAHPIMPISSSLSAPSVIGLRLPNSSPRIKARDHRVLRASPFLPRTKFETNRASSGSHFGARTASKFPGPGLRTRTHSPRASASSTAAASGGPSGLPNVLRNVVAALVAWCSRLVAAVERLRFGPLRGGDVVGMVRLLLLGCTALVAYVASKRAWVKIREHAGGGGGDGGPMQILAKGATCLQSNMGPWSLHDFTLGLAAMAKMAEKRPPELPGEEETNLCKDPEFLLKAQHWRSLAEAVYVKDSASFSLLSQLPESAIVGSEWEPCQESLRPAYAVVVDAPMGAIVLAVRGTSHVIDMLLNSGAAPEPFRNGSAHGGFAHASNVLYEQALPHLEKAFEAHGEGKKLVIVGHSMGAAVGVMCGLKLREKWPDLECWGYCPPASLTLELATECADFMTSFVASHDLVPRFSISSVEDLRERVYNFDWDEVEKVAKGDEDWENIKKAMETMKGLKQAQDQAMKAVNDKKEKVMDSEAGRKVQKAGDQVASSDAGEKAQEAGQQAGDFIEGRDAKEEEKEEDGKPMPKLYPPGKLLVLGSDPPGSGRLPEQRKEVASERSYGTYPSFEESRKIRWVMHRARQEEMGEIVVSPWCISDHMLGNMCEAIGWLQRQSAPALSH